MTDRGTRDRQTQAFVWGYNSTGALGIGHTASAHRPTADLAAGDSHEVAPALE